MFFYYDSESAQNTGSETQLSPAAAPISPLTFNISSNNLNFNSIYIGSAGAQTVTVAASNVGNANYFETLTISDNSADYAASTSSLIMYSNETKSFGINFAPLAPAGLKTGAITLSSSGGSVFAVNVTGVALTPALTLNAQNTLAFNTTYVGSTSVNLIAVTASNVGDQNYFETLTISDNDSQFAPVTASTTLYSGEIKLIGVAYSPTFSGAHAGTLSISASGGSIKNVTLTGSAIPIPALTYTSSISTLQFDSTNVNATSIKYLAITASYSANPLLDLSETVTVTDNSVNFTVLTSSLIMANGQTSLIGIQFNPTGTAGTKTGTLTISGSGGSTRTVTLRGSGLAVKASATLNGITYTAKTAGAAGNNITITHTNGIDNSTYAGLVLFTMGNLQTYNTFPNDSNGTSDPNYRYVKEWMGFRAKQKGSAGNTLSVRLAGTSGLAVCPIPNSPTNFASQNTNPSGGVNFDYWQGTPGTAVYSYIYKIYNAFVAAGITQYMDVFYGNPKNLSDAQLGSSTGLYYGSHAITPEFGNFINYNTTPGVAINTADTDQGLEYFSRASDSPQINLGQLHYPYQNTNKWLDFNTDNFSRQTYGFYLQNGVDNSEPTALTTNSATSQIVRIDPREIAISNIVTYINSTSTYVSASGGGSAVPVNMTGSIKLSGGAG